MLNSQTGIAPKSEKPFVLKLVTCGTIPYNSLHKAHPLAAGLGVSLLLKPS
jgi:hypothetical protein